MLDTTRPLVAQLILNLERYVRFSEEDRRGLDGLGFASIVEARARGDIVREGDNPTVVRLVIEGWACRYKDLPDGRRQIVGFFLPGDFCDLNVYILQTMDHSIGAITSVRYLAIPPETLEKLAEQRPRVARALLWHELVNSSVQREWLLNIGARSALERMAHLLVELFVRLRAIGKTEGNTCHFPLIQADLADATGITPVHVNRTLQELRRDGLIELRAKRLKILDFERLKRLAMFNPNYLHLDHEGRHLDAND